MRRPTLLATTILVLSASAAPALGAAVKRPGGQYSGERGRFVLSVSGRTIDLAGFDFRCGTTSGRTSLNDVPIRKVRGLWRFSIRSAGSASFADDRPDENVRIAFSGRFSPSAKVARGRLKVSAPSCRRSTARDWTSVRLAPS